MTILKLNEQIAFLRKQKGLTQEELANALGVTNQTVSKWESAQCCPDIQLLPELANFFHISVDALLGYTPASMAEDLVLSLCKEVTALPEGADSDFVFKSAAALHAILLTKKLADSGMQWDPVETMERAGNAAWGYSCCSIPEITTTMRRGAVFFSNNKHLTTTNIDAYRIASILRPFGDATNLKIATALYQLTAHSEDACATAMQISQQSGIAFDTVQNRLTVALSQFIHVKEGSELVFRFDGMYRNILPILSLLDYK